MKEKIIVVGAGVSGACLITKLIDNGYPGELITIIDKGKDPHKRQPEETMIGWLGCGGFSDGKLTYHTAIGGQLSKYCGEEKAYNYMDQTIDMFKRFHPQPDQIFKSDPQEEPEFIKPYFNLRLFPVQHFGSNFLHALGKTWYDYLENKGVNFLWDTEVIEVDLENSRVVTKDQTLNTDRIIIGAGKSGIDFTNKLIKQYNLPSEGKSGQIGVRFEAPQKYFQKLIDISYDFKLYKKTEKYSARSFCTNNTAAYVAVEETYGDISYNGHALKDDNFINNMTNFGIIMEVKGIDDPFKWSRELVKRCQIGLEGDHKGVYYSPSRHPSNTSEGIKVLSYETQDIETFKYAFGEYAYPILEFVDEMNKIFGFGDDWGMYFPEIKYVTPEVLVNYNNLSLIDYPHIHLMGDSLSSRGITSAGSQGILIAETLLK